MMISKTAKPQSFTYPEQVTWVDTPGQLHQLTAALMAEPLVAVDTEADSLYSYFEKVCLIQFSTPTADFLVDPLTVDVSALAPLFASRSTQKIFHAAEYDILSLKRDYGFTFANLFDTMIAARILGWDRYGLGALLETHFNIKLDKRFQRYNWGKRPIGAKALAYAQLDTHYLLPLRQIQLAQLEQQNREREAAEAFERVAQVEPSPKVFDPDDFWRIKGARDFEPQQQAILRELFILRDKIARKINRPPFKVMNDSTLIQITRILPAHLRDLQAIKGIGDKLIQHNGAELLQAIRQGQTAPPPQYHGNHHHTPDNHTLNRYETLRHWRNGVAAQRGVEPDVIMTNSNLMDIARKNPKSLHALENLGVLGSWQYERYGKLLLKVLKDTVRH